MLPSKAAGLAGLGNLVLVMGFRERKDIWERPSFLLGKVDSSQRMLLVTAPDRKKRKIPYLRLSVIKPWWAEPVLISAVLAVRGWGLGDSEGAQQWTRGQE